MFTFPRHHIMAAPTAAAAAVSTAATQKYTTHPLSTTSAFSVAILIQVAYYRNLYYYYYLLIRVFHISFSRWFFPGVWVTASLLKSLPSILAVLNNVVVWMVSTRPPTSKSSSSFSNPLVTVPKAPITIGIIQLFQFSSKVKVLILLFILFQFYSVVSRNSKVNNFANTLFKLNTCALIKQVTFLH